MSCFVLVKEVIKMKIKTVVDTSKRDDDAMYHISITTNSVTDYNKFLEVINGLLKPTSVVVHNTGATPVFKKAVKAFDVDDNFCWPSD